MAITGVFPQLAREDLASVVLTYGGRVSGSVSKRTSFLLVGDTLESGDAVTASAKHRAAVAAGVRTLTLDAFLEHLAALPAQGACFRAQPPPHTKPTRPSPRRAGRGGRP